MDDVKEVIDICTRFNLGEEISLEEIKSIAYNDLTEANWCIWNYAVNTFNEIMSVYGAKEWDDEDPNFTNNPYHFGWKLDDVIFITGYTGVAGCFWREEDGHYTIAFK